MTKEAVVYVRKRMQVLDYEALKRIVDTGYKVEEYDGRAVVDHCDACGYPVFEDQEFTMCEGSTLHENCVYMIDVSETSEEQEDYDPT